ncbi:AzlD domain-containing protein [Parvibaculum sp.]|jgi:branched-subunit amino acid transport protein|uniref:AzlD domain-containing protein n=1 Tax=Parvibaculum sp. TaxID=2024848 RepID=UPI0025CFC757|nr:AzlD domain-containing protein [Parvibaculum sp.]
MSQETIWLSLLALGLGTFLLRLSFVELAGRFVIPAGLTKALRFLPAAVLSAIILPAILRVEPGALYFGLDNPRLAAGVLAALVAWTTKSVLATLAIGMSTLWLTQALF